MLAAPSPSTWERWVETARGCYVLMHAAMRRRSNCIVWARGAERRLLLWAAMPGREHWRVLHSRRWSDWGRFRHHLVVMVNTRTGGHHVVSYKPISPKRRAVPPPWFKGAVVWGDRR